MNDRRSVFGAVDVGASGGRVVAGIVAGDVAGDVGDRSVEIDIVHRFENGATERDGHLRWDFERLFAEILTGLGELARRYPDVHSIGIDTWAVDYGRLDRRGNLIDDPFAYRDDRTSAAVEEVQAVVPAAELFAVNGLQVLAFNTLYQLHVDRQAGLLDEVDTVLLLPDLIGHRLTGRVVAEITNASTTGLLDATRRCWSTELITRLGLDPAILPPLVEPGENLGPISAGTAGRTGLRSDVSVCAVGSHDTASAVVGVPAENSAFAYISCGTWSLVGLELSRPVLTEAARQARFTNEGGVSGRIRFLRNVGGLWLLQESIRHWRDHDETAELAELLSAAASCPAGGPVIDVDSDEFLAPGDMPARIARACADSRSPLRQGQGPLVRCILDSLAAAYARTLAQAEQLTGRSIEVVHLVGGGARNELLCQLTADACGRPVLAGPVEATAIGNVCVQASAAGVLPADLESIRAVIAAGTSRQRFEPDPASVRMGS